MKHALFKTLCVTALFFPAITLAGSISAGIPTDALWFSKDPFFQGDKITIFAVLYNSSSYEMNGTIALLNGTSTISTKQFRLIGGGESTIVPFSWTVTSGDHEFAAEIIKNEISLSDKLVGHVEVTRVKTGAVKRFADIDTDVDGIGNTLDEDDDGDGLSDEDEVKLGTNPLLADTDGDGERDDTDAHPLEKYVPEIVPSNTQKEAHSSLSERVLEKIPEPIQQKAIPIIGAIETYRQNAARENEASVQRVSDEVNKSSASSTNLLAASTTQSGWEIFRTGAISEDIIHSPLGYAKLFFILLWQFVLSNIYAFYLFLAIILYFVVRFIWVLFH